MKIRTGFVSNSSSSSFIVAAEKDNTEIDISIKVNLKNYGEILDTKGKLDAYFMSEYGMDNYNNIEDNLSTDVFIKYQECLEAIKGGKIIIFGSFSDDDGDNISGFLCNNGIPKDTKNIKIIQNDGGY